MLLLLPRASALPDLPVGAARATPRREQQADFGRVPAGESSLHASAHFCLMLLACLLLSSAPVSWLVSIVLLEAYAVVIFTQTHLA